MPAMGRSSKRAAQNPKAEGAHHHNLVNHGRGITPAQRTSVVPLAFFDERRNLPFRHPFGLEVL